MIDVTIPEPLRSLRIALVHDYLNQPGGAEKVVEVFTEMFPGAPVYTSVYDADCMPDVWRSVDVRTSFMQRISPRLRIAKVLVPLYPTAFESFDLRGYDLILSSTTAFAKGVITRPESCHVCYCNNPSRFLWMYHDYMEYERYPALLQSLLPFCATPMRLWDYAAAQRTDYFVGGSRNAARRIWKYYRRVSDVVQAPIDASAFEPSDEIEDYFLVVSRLQSYKRIDLAIEACNRLGLRLNIVGDGPDRARLEKLAGPNIRFFGRLNDGHVGRQMARCRALIFPGEEDFGLTPLEAQASGRPVIAFGAGGALETVIEGETGLFFRESNPASLIEVLDNFRDVFDPKVLRRNALRFDKSVFKQRMFAVLQRCYQKHLQRLDGALDPL